VTTISNTVRATVTLGSSADPSPLTISATGEILAPGGGYDNGDPGVYAAANVTNPVLFNKGIIHAGVGGMGIGSQVAGTGGTGVLFMALGTVANAGQIIGGTGGHGLAYPNPNGLNLITYFGGLGGVGVALGGGGLLTNSGTITGGEGGGSGTKYGYGYGGAGGTGVLIAAGGTLSNTGFITGGAGYQVIAGAHDYFIEANVGGAGVTLLSGGVITNSSIGTISGGIGGSHGFDGGGAIYLLAGGTLNNAGDMWAALATARRARPINTLAARAKPVVAA
jgi:hypothetical protein